jgi:hypothetical protein
MKHVIASLTIGACLVLPSAGVAFAANPHPSNPSTNTGTGKGQPGANNAAGGVGCEVTANAGTTPGHASSAPGSPFNEPGINSPSGGNAGTHYAGNGANTSTPANSAAVSEYDVACLQHSVP